MRSSGCGPVTPSWEQAQDGRSMTRFAARSSPYPPSRFWEVAMLKSKGRLDFPEDVGLWRRELLGQGLAEIPVDGEIGIRANALPGFHPDPVDRIIVATALQSHTLITADQAILEWRGNLNRQDARE